MGFAEQSLFISRLAPMRLQCPAVNLRHCGRSTDQHHSLATLWHSFMVITSLSRSMLFTLLGMTLLAACKSTPKPAECDENRGAYLQATSNGDLKVAEGEQAPDRRNALTIPASNGKAVDTRACLQQSPSYFGTPGRIAASPEEIVADWAQAWANRNADGVMSMYSTKFTTDAPAGSTGWLDQRRTEIGAGPLPNPRVTGLKVTQSGNDERIATFVQQFGTTRVRKELKLIRDAGLWKIASERVITAQ